METLLVIATGAGALMGFAHYALPRLLRRDPHPLERFFVGVTLGILAPFAAWTWLDGANRFYLIVLLTVCAGAGAGTLAAYLLDWWGGRGE